MTPPHRLVIVWPVVLGWVLFVVALVWAVATLAHNPAPLVVAALGGLLVGRYHPRSQESTE